MMNRGAALEGLASRLTSEGRHRGRCALLIDGCFDFWCIVVQNASMTSTPTPNVRLTISITPEVHEVFKRFAAAAGMSISRAMGEWLGDTIEAAQFTASKMEQARAAPALAMREMHSYALGLVDETTDLMEKIKAEGAKRRAGVAPASPERRVAPIPPPSNTGGKGTKSKPIPRVKKSVSTLGKSSVGPAKVQAYADTNGIPPKGSK